MKSISYSDFKLCCPFLLRTVESPDNDLSVYLTSGKAVSEDDKIIDDPNPAVQELLQGATQIVPDSANVWHILFESYIQYHVMNESFSCPDSASIVSNGKIIERINNSRFVEYVKSSFIFAEMDEVYFKGKELQHYRISTANHIIEVATFYEPIIKKVGAAE